MSNPNQQEIDEFDEILVQLDEAQRMIDRAQQHAAHNGLDTEEFYAQLNDHQSRVNRQRTTIETLKAHYQTFH